MKTSAHKALASLTHKYQTKICQLGHAYRREDELVERIQNLEAELHTAQTALRLGKGRNIYQEDFLLMEKRVKRAEDQAQRATIAASKWESWACAYAVWAAVASAALGVVAYQHAVLTGLL